MRYFLLLAITLLVIFPTSASAHILKTDGPIGAVLHISPEDDPAVGELSGFYFEFKDTSGKFKPENCACIVSVFKAGEEIYTQPLFQDSSDPSLTNPSFDYTFPERNIYKIKVVGKPNSPGQFDPFTLEYDIRVVRVSEVNWMGNNVPYYVGGVIFFMLLVVSYIKSGRR